MPKARIVIIDRQSDERKQIAQCIERHFGLHSAVAMASLAQALRLPLDRFDLILCSHQSPGAPVFALLEQIQRISQTPVILVTGENDGATAAEAIRRGAMDYIVKTEGYLFTIPLVIEKNLTLARIHRDNASLRRQLETALHAVKEKNAQLVDSLRRVEQLAATDTLTGIYNRRHFSRVCEQLFSEAYRYGKDLACIMLDLDAFKQVNDTQGHQIGDAVLTLAGRTISNNLRKMDVAARYGGDEFCILLPQAGIDEACVVGERIRQQFHLALQAAMPEVRTSLSLGVATCKTVEPIMVEQLVAAADAALYRAKRAGRDRLEAVISLARSRGAVNQLIP